MRTGESVFNGDVHGRACVVRAVHDIRHLEQGDVLITSSVNLSWSPYFAMLSGLVTEASGVLSYGATLAKDFEVPCVVGVENATLIFETGDMVLLSGKNGTVQLSS
uniref:PEP-utilising enzyme mobile domain-containing protein n=6 Tax=Photinus pyralis TaxID=7054 RepID=A0A1Y1L6V1_PHOPY